MEGGGGLRGHCFYGGVVVRLVDGELGFVGVWFGEGGGGPGVYEC